MQILQHGTILIVECIALGQIDILIRNGIAAENILIAIAIADGHEIAADVVDIIEVRDPGLRTAGVLQIAAHIVHTGLRPGAVEAQDRDGMGNGFLRHGILHRHSKDIALHIGTGGVIGIQILLRLLRQLQSDLHGHGAAGGDIHAVSARESVQQHMGIVGGDVAVTVHIAVGLQLGFVAQQVFQQEIGIRSIGDAAAVQVAVKAFSGALQGDAILEEGCICLQIAGPGIHAQIVIAVAEQILGKKIRRQPIGHGLAVQIMDGEGEGVGALTLSILAKLRLDLAVGHPADHHIALGGGSQIHPGKTGTLVQNGVILSAGGRIVQRHRCGHH